MAGTETVAFELSIPTKYVGDDQKTYVIRQKPKYYPVSKLAAAAGADLSAPSFKPQKHCRHIYIHTQADAVAAAGGSPAIPARKVTRSVPCAITVVATPPDLSAVTIDGLTAWIVGGYTGEKDFK